MRTQCRLVLKQRTEVLPLPVSQIRVCASIVLCFRRSSHNMGLVPLTCSDMAPYVTCVPPVLHVHARGTSKHIQVAHLCRTKSLLLATCLSVCDKRHLGVL